MPLHDGLQHGGQEPAVPPRLVLRAAGDRVGDVAEDPIIADQSREVRGLQHVDHIHKFRGVDCITKIKYIFEFISCKYQHLRESENTSRE